MKNLEGMMIGLSEFKSKLSEVINNSLTKVIVKNNTPVSVVLPYDEYLALKKQAEDNQSNICRIGQDITMNNGVPLMVTVNKEDNGLCIKTYIKMKTSGDYKLHFTQHLGSPTTETMYTTDELIDKMHKEYEKRNK